MLNPIAMSLPKMAQAPADVDMRLANTVFKLLHGAYGNLFLNKFSTGQLDASGRDNGVTSARKTWAYALNQFSQSTVEAAVAQFLDQTSEYPPSLPQVVALCKANKPRATYQPAVPEIAMGQPLRSQYAAQARAINERHAQRSIEKRLGAVFSGVGLDGLKQAIASAVGAAGGDEAAELRRLDLMLQAGGAK